VSDADDKAARAALDERLLERCRDVFGWQKGAEELIAICRALVKLHDTDPNAEWLTSTSQHVSTGLGDQWRSHRWVSISFLMPAALVDKAIGFVDVQPSPLDLEQRARFGALELDDAPPAALEQIERVEPAPSPDYDEGMPF
jgi:hypothetical protein